MFRGLRLAMGRVDPDSPEVFREVIAEKPAIGNPRLIQLRSLLPSARDNRVVPSVKTGSKYVLLSNINDVQL